MVACYLFERRSLIPTGDFCHFNFLLGLKAIVAPHTQSTIQNCTHISGEALVICSMNSCQGIKHTNKLLLVKY